VHTPAAVSRLLNVLPFQAYDVADAQARKAGEQRRGAYDWFLARGVGEALHFFERKELAVCVGFLRVLQSYGDVILDVPVEMRLSEDAFQFVEVVVGGRCHHLCL